MGVAAVERLSQGDDSGVVDGSTAEAVHAAVCVQGVARQRVSIVSPHEGNIAHGGSGHLPGHGGLGAVAVQRHLDVVGRAGLCKPNRIVRVCCLECVFVWRRTVAQ